MSPGGRTSASIRWWTELSTHLVGSGLRIAVLGQLPADLLEALQAAKPKLDVHPSTLPKQSAFELVLCGVDLPLAEGAAAFGALRELGSRALLVSTPEDQRDEQLVAPRLDEWVTWFAARGHLRDFRRDAITATGCVPLRHDVEPGAVLGAYERQLEQRERAFNVIRAVAERYRGELAVREHEIDHLHFRIAVQQNEARAMAAATASAAPPPQVVSMLPPALSISDELLVGVRHLATIRRRFAPESSIRARMFDWSITHAVRAEETLLRTFDTRDAILGTCRLWMAKLRPGARSRR